MAEAVQEKSRGLKFAERQLLRHGWEHGKGLGRAENGICEAIKVKVKCDKGGVGHKEGEQFTFHWWDHVFNKASSSLQVESDQNGIKLRKTVEEEEDGMISNKKPRKATLAKDKLYGCFVKSATLLSGREQPEPKPSDSEDSSSSDEEDEQRLDLSSTTKLSDADLMKACGGRTAHKGARHGLTMSAKLARLEQQEAEFMAKYGKKSQPPSASALCGKPAPRTSKSADEQEERPEDTQSRKMKRKSKSSTLSVIEPNGSEVSESPEADVKPRKKKKKKKKADDDDAEEITDAVSTKDVICVEPSDKTKSKQKKKKKKVEQNEEQRTTSTAAESESVEETTELHSVSNAKKKKKKKKSSSKHHNEVEESNDTESSQSEPVQSSAPKTKKRKAAVLMEEAEVPEEESTVKGKRTKCEKNKQPVDEQTLPPKKKKKKKKCRE